MVIMNTQRHRKSVAYYRVSADRQDRSRRRLDAQRKAVAAYLNGGARELVGEFTEIESASNANARR
jgi:DNA invertase Pin-like site-specific DNA recombinase